MRKEANTSAELRLEFDHKELALSSAKPNCIMMRSVTLVSILLTLFSTNTAFAPVPVAQMKTTHTLPTPLAASTLREDDDWKERPRKQNVPSPVADATELNIGRVAMVGISIFLINEALTGDSILTQVMHAIARL